MLALSLLLQATHLLVLTTLHHPLLSSNILQWLATLPPTLLCLVQVRRASSRLVRRRWLLLAGAFLIWTAGQVFYLCAILLQPWRSILSSASDMCWLLYAFPLLMATSVRENTTGRGDLVFVLDLAQGGLFCVILCVLALTPHGALTLSHAYNLQSVAVLFMVGTRLSRAGGQAEWIFSRNVAAYSAVYAVAIYAGYTLPDFGYQAGSIADIFWTLPFTAFCLLVVRFSGVAGAESKGSARRAPALSLPTRFQGLSAFGLASMAGLAAWMLSLHSMRAGSFGLGAAFLLFAARTSMREWQLESARTRLANFSAVDMLTGLATRSVLHPEWTRRLSDSVGGARPALLIIDLDRFKNVNDGLGQNLGDLVLRRTAEVLTEAALPEDLVVRHNGDEFVILTDAAHAEALARKVLVRFRAPLSLAHNGSSLHLTVSIGVALGRANSTAEETLQDAACAMHRAKQLGKDRMEVFDPSMLEASRQKLAIENELRKAVEDGDIQVAYQPIYRMGDRSVEGFEALARWRRSDGIWVSPAEFIPIAEETGIILDLGWKVMEQACHQAQEWNRKMGTRITIGVNVSTQQFMQPRFLERVEEVLNTTGLDPRLLKLEITESILLGETHAVEEMLSRARALGVRVCLDDFGTGYSSLSYLLRFPFDVIKVDRSFVTNMHKDRRRAELVRMMVQLGHMLRKQVIAEGIESEAEMTALQALDCDLVQGCLLPRPPPAEAAEALLSREGRALGANASGREAQPATTRRLVQSAAQLLGTPAAVRPDDLEPTPISG